MQPLIIEATSDTPKIHLDAEKGYFEIANLSLPEDAIEFYKPVIKWIKDYFENPNEKTDFNFKLEYFNTASSKQIVQILLLLEKLSKTHNILIKWHYKDIDEDMQDLGEEYADIIDIDFELVVYK